MVHATKNVIVVDDDPDFLRAVSRLIRLAGYDVQGTSSITGLVGLLPTPPVCCILADVILRGESGLEIPALLRSKGDPSPVVFMSATDDEEMIEAAGLKGDLPCLQKPLEASDLLAALDAAFTSTIAEQTDLRSIGEIS